MATNTGPYPELSDGNTYLSNEANKARANHVIRNDYNADASYPDNLDSYNSMVGNNVFDF